ncbi:MAG: threonylcarbamoyl-AMP synthase [Nitrospirae bacterium]|nr:threonylcarbamoyl-AMP synthase [Nitrospirota bacterium]
MKIYKVTQSSPDPSVITELADLLKSGSVIAYPTDTFYGLGADISNQFALERLYTIKKRMPNKPIIILISDMMMLRPLIADGYLSETAKKLIDRFWPGPLTLVFRASDLVPAVLTANTGKIGIRLPDSELCKLIIDKLKHPITATSANISGDNSTNNPAEVEESMGNSIDALADGGITNYRGASTVVDITGEQPVILREGAIPFALINELITVQ